MNYKYVCWTLDWMNHSPLTLVRSTWSDNIPVRTTCRHAGHTSTKPCTSHLQCCHLLDTGGIINQWRHWTAVDRNQSICKYKKTIVNSNPTRISVVWWFMCVEAVRRLVIHWLVCTSSSEPVDQRQASLYTVRAAVALKRVSDLPPEVGQEVYARA